MIMLPRKTTLHELRSRTERGVMKPPIPKPKDVAENYVTIVENIDNNTEPVGRS